MPPPMLPSGQPEPRLIRQPRDAEIAAAEWLRFWGFADAATHGPGVDGGIDVEALELVVQVKARVSTAGRPELQQLFGAAAARGKRAVFFSLGGYSSQARQWADEAPVALFEFDLQGEPRPVNAMAASLAGLQLDESGEVDIGPPDSTNDERVSADSERDVAISASVSDEDTNVTIGSIPSTPPPRDGGTGGPRAFVKYSRTLRRNGHHVTGYALGYAETPDDRELIRRWAEAGVTGNYVVVDHHSGRVEGHRTWASAYAATCEWDGGVLAPSVRSSIGQQATPTEDT